VSTQAISPEIAEGLDLKQTQDALVAEPPARQSCGKGRHPIGRHHQSLQGKPVTDERELSKMVSDMAPGTKVEVGVVRQGEKNTVALALGQLPSPRSEAPPGNEGSQEGSTDPSKLGLTLAPAAQTAKSSAEAWSSLKSIPMELPPSAAFRPATLSSTWQGIR
jgi:serine protease Do